MGLLESLVIDIRTRWLADEGVNNFGQLCGAISQHVRDVAKVLCAVADDRKASENQASKPEDNLISIQALADFQFALEFLVICGIYPALLRLGFFGDIAWKCPESELVAKFLEHVRRPSKTLKIEADKFLIPINASVAASSDKCMHDEEAMWLAVLRTCSSTLKHCCEVDSYAPFLLGKNLPEMLLSECALHCFENKEFKEGLQFPDLSLHLHVKGLLGALQAQNKFAIVLKSLKSSRYLWLSEAIGHQLSESILIDGGVAVIILEMLENIDYGNVNAFRKVASLLIARKDNISVVCEQLCRLLSSVVLDEKQKLNFRKLIQRSVSITINELANRYGSASVLAHVLVRLSPTLFIVSDGVISDKATKLADEVKLLFGILDASPPNAPLLNAFTTGICSAIELSIFSYCNHTSGEGNSRALVLKWFSYSSSDTIASVMRRVASNFRPIGSLGLLSSQTSEPTRIEETNVEVQLFRDENGQDCAKINTVETGLTSDKDLATKRKPVLFKYGNVTNIAKDEMADEFCEEEETALIRIRYILRMVHNLPAIGAVFLSCLRGTAKIFTESSLSAQSISDLLFIQALMDGEQVQGKELSAFSFSTKFVQAGEVVDVCALLLDSCAEALGTNTFDSDNDRMSPLSHLALDICPCAIAIAGCLASYDANDELWKKNEMKSHSRFSILRKLLSPLNKISNLDVWTTAVRLIASLGDVEKESSDAEKMLISQCRELAEAALAVRIGIFASFSTKPKNSCSMEEYSATFHVDDNTIDPIGVKIAEAQKNLQDSQPPVRAMGLDQLKDIVLGRLDTKILPTQKHLDAILASLLESLNDADPYVYLTSIRAIGSVCEVQPRKFLPYILNMFVDKNNLSLSSRLRLGEVIKLACHRAGETFPVYASAFIRTLCNGAAYRHRKDGFDVTRECVDNKGRYLGGESVDNENACDHEADLVTPFRVSCMANLADCCALAPRVAFEHANILAGLARGTLLFETSVKVEGLTVSKDEKRQLRRAAAYMLLQILNGALLVTENEAINEIPEALIEIHRTINRGSASDEDPIVRLRCDQARAIYDSIVKSYLSPKSDKKSLIVSIPHT